MSETIDIETIRRKRADLADLREKLVTKIARLETEIAELNVTERTVAKLLGIAAPLEIDHILPANIARTPKPDDLPAMPEMITDALAKYYRQGRRGLTPKEIREEIARAFWPDVPNEAVGPIAWRMFKRGELEKTPDNLYALPKDKAPAVDAEASKVTDELPGSSIESQSDLLKS
ncbi:hypothetical protein NL532_00665 [Mesorhizobium sp. C120A]|uniref:hypothetical protein n=1 Tax=unclassified Mesorhizobium TaxID=325217 RepID=UPI0003CFAF1D|nr:MULTISPECIES: hypothetical protein [unclassified Mesorhizobium]ESZ63789.1 hypothetical protein X728_09765 [Mesorhizobium sp. L103C120A0]WJI45209.1 hypothetical protein NL532_00665 [Mesorhizobium sp. C120A]